MDNKNVSEVANNDAFAKSSKLFIRDSFVPIGLTKIDTEDKLNQYIGVLEKYSPFFIKENLYKNVDTKKILSDLWKTKKIDWFTDCIPLSIDMNLHIAIATNTVLKLQVAESEYAKIENEIFSASKNLLKQQLEKLEAEIDNQIQEYANNNLSKDIDSFLINNELEPNDKNKQLAHDILLNQYRAKLSRIETQKIVDTNFIKIIEHANKDVASKISFKDSSKTAANDYWIAGPPASGKSTVANKFLTEENTKNSIIFNPDAYRIFTENAIDTSKFTALEIKNNNMAITADLIDYISTNINNAISDQKNKRNISLIIDSSSYSKNFPKLLNNGAKIVLVAYYGHSTYDSGLLARNKNRGDNAENIVDKRYFNSDHLLSTHKNYSNAVLLNLLPSKFNIEIRDMFGKDLTGQIKDNSDSVIATISPQIDNNTGELRNILEVRDPIAFVEFINKENINANAKHTLEVLQFGKNPLDKTNEKIQTFENFCKKAEDKGAVIKDKDKIIDTFKSREFNITQVSEIHFNQVTK